MGGSNPQKREREEKQAAKREQQKLETVQKLAAKKDAAEQQKLETEQKQGAKKDAAEQHRLEKEKKQAAKKDAAEQQKREGEKKRAAKIDDAAERTAIAAHRKKDQWVFSDPDSWVRWSKASADKEADDAAVAADEARKVLTVLLSWT